MAKRILVVTQHFWPENFRVNDLVEGLVEDGCQVDVLCGLPNYPKGEWFEGYRYIGPRRQEYAGARVFRSGEIRRKGNTGLRIFLNYCYWPVSALFSLPRLKGQYDAVLCYNTSPVMMALPALVYGKLKRIPVTTYVLDLWPENLYSVLPVRNPLLRAIAHRVSDWFYRRADKLIAMSPSLGVHLAQRTGKATKKIAVIPQYCEDFYARPALDQDLAQQYEGKFLLVFTGTFSRHQSRDPLIPAAALAHKDCPSLHLLLVGDGMSRSDLEALVKELEAGAFISFYGSVPPTRIPAIAGAAQGLVVSLGDSPDLGLTVPAKVASYMAMGKPILASMNGEGYAAVKESGAGLVSPAADVKALAANMTALAETSSPEREIMGQKAREYYQAHYDRATLLKQLEKFI